jgi:hypothetical protein
MILSASFYTLGGNNQKKEIFERPKLIKELLPIKFYKFKNIQIKHK